MSWPKVELSTITSLIMGQSPPGSTYNTDGEGKLFLTAGDFGKIRPEITRYTTSPTKLAEVNDVLICVVGATAGKINLGANCCIGRSVAAIRPIESRLNQYYLYYFMLNWVERIRAAARGSAQAIITRKMIEELQIPLPPLDEQKRIATILDKADEIKHTAEKSKFSRSQLSQSLFLEMFGDPTQDNTGFEQFKLSEIIEEGDKINYGVVQPGGEFPEGHHLIRAGNVIDGLVPEYMKRIDPNIELKYSRSRIKGNEILIVCVGSIGEVALVREEHIGFNIARAVCRIPIKNSISRIYVSEYLKLASVQSRIKAEIREVAQPTLNIKQIKELVISIPETSKMEEFERVMISVSSWESVLSSRNNQIENSLNSITQEMLT